MASLRPHPSAVGYRPDYRSRTNLNTFSILVQSGGPIGTLICERPYRTLPDYRWPKPSHVSLWAWSSPHGEGGGRQEGGGCPLGTEPRLSAYDRQYVTAIIVSQDWDVGPTVGLPKEIAKA